MADTLPAAPVESDDRERRPPPSLNESTVWRLATGILGQVSLLTALLLFFGWARTQATFAYFGVDLSLLDFSTTDYVLRSVNTAYSPLLMLGLAALAGALVHRWLARGRLPPARIRLGLSIAGWALVALGVSALLWGAWAQRVGRWIPDEPGVAFAWLPVSLTAGFAVLLYASLAWAPRERPPSTHTTFALVALLVMALFWTVSLLAVHDGRERAQAIERDPGALPEVALLSKDVLVIQAPGVIGTPIRIPGSRYRHSYAGLRMLAHAQGKYLLIPLTWRRGRDRVYSIPDDPSIRIELIAH